jgi:hypothetical protein
LGKSQSFTVPSSLAEASVRPSGEKATERTRLVCPVRMNARSFVATSNTVTDPSSVETARRRPAGE